MELLRRQRWTGLHIAVQTGMSRATVSRILRRLKLNRKRGRRGTALLAVDIMLPLAADIMLPLAAAFIPLLLRAEPSTVVVVSVAASMEAVVVDSMVVAVVTGN